MAGAPPRTATVDHGGRGGYVTYSDPSGTLQFSWEGAAYGFEVMIPTPADWESQTGLPLAAREDTLAFIAERFIAARGQPSWTFRIVDGRFSALEIRA